MAERGKIFKDAPIIAPNRSWFDMSYENTFSMNIGENVPAAIYECLPGDHVKAKTDSITRFSPMLAPVMTSINQFSYHFYVRMRDIWTNFDKFITNNDQRANWQANVTNFVAPTMPYFKVRDILYNKLGQDITERNFETGTVDFINDPKTYRLIFMWHHVPNTSDEIWVFCDKAIHPSYLLPTPGTAQTWSYVIVNFKPNPNEFDEDYSMGVNGVPNDLYRKNVFGNGSLLDFLGLDTNAIYASQWDYYRNILDNAHSSASHTYRNMCDLDNVDKIIKGEEFKNAIFHWNEMPDNLLASGSVEDIKLQDIDFDSLKTFFSNHAVEEVLTGYRTSASNIYFVDLNARGRIKVDSSNPTQISGTALSAIAEDPLCALPIRAYRFIYDEYFRDQNYIPVNPLTDFTRDGDEFATITASSPLSDLNILVDYLSITRKAWEHDPYTTALPGPQRGQAVHFLPQSVDINQTLTNYQSSRQVYEAYFTQGSSGQPTKSVTGSVGTTATGYEVKMSADLSAATIENFRWANSMQKYLEKKARTGGRYFEYLLGIWNKSVDDSKLNRPIYINGDRTPIQVSEVLQTSATDITSRQALGDMAGRGIALGSDEFIEYECPDYGYFIELTCVLPRVAYQSGVSPIFTKENYLDFPLPDFAQLGEEYVKQKELYYLADVSQDNKAFGYQSRYYNYKYRRSEIHGEMKDSLDFWHFGRKFDSAPVNGKLFIECHPDYRQFAVTFKGFEHVYCQMWHDVQMNRALPEYGVPVL